MEPQVKVLMAVERVVDGVVQGAVVLGEAGCQDDNGNIPANPPGAYENGGYGGDGMQVRIAGPTSATPSVGTPEQIQVVVILREEEVVVINQTQMLH